MKAKLLFSQQNKIDFFLNVKRLHMFMNRLILYQFKNGKVPIY